MPGSRLGEMLREVLARQDAVRILRPATAPTFWGTSATPAARTTLPVSYWWDEATTFFDEKEIEMPGTHQLERQVGYDRSLFIGEQYFEHGRARATHSIRFWDASYDNASRQEAFSTARGEGVRMDFMLANSAGLASGFYHIGVDQQARNRRGEDFHYEYERERIAREKRMKEKRENLKYKMQAATERWRVDKHLTAAWRGCPVISGSADYDRRQAAQWLEGKKYFEANVADYVAKAKRSMATGNEQAAKDYIVSLYILLDSESALYLRTMSAKELIHKLCLKHKLPVYRKCFSCSRMHFHEEHIIVYGYDANNRVALCDYCMRIRYTYSDLLGCWIRNANSVLIYPDGFMGSYANTEGTIRVPPEYAREHFYHSDSTGMWFRTREAAYQYEDQYEDGSMNGYHSSSRSEYFVEVNSKGTRPALGVELEVYCQDDRAATIVSLRKVYRKRELIIERDGSLDDESGMEIVTRPFGFEEWMEYGPKLLKELRDREVVGWNTEDYSGMYGIHVNLHRRWLSPLAEARIMMLLCAEQNKKFVQAIAQRGSIYGPSVNIGGLRSAGGQRIIDINDHNEEFAERVYTRANGKTELVRKIYGRGKYCPVNFKEDIAEFRMFHSTLNEVSFLKNLEFVWSLVRWTAPESATGSSWEYTDYLKWLNQPSNRKEYPNLVKYLSKKSFPVRNVGTVTNSWLTLMAKPIEEAHSEGTDA